MTILRAWTDRTPFQLAAVKALVMPSKYMQST